MTRPSAIILIIILILTFNPTSFCGRLATLTGPPIRFCFLMFLPTLPVPVPWGLDDEAAEEGSYESFP